MTYSQDLPAPTLTSRLVSALLGIKPLANFAKERARSMMIKRAEGIGVYWIQEADALRSRRELGDRSDLAPKHPASNDPASNDPNAEHHFSEQWEADLAQIRDDSLVYPDYYLTSFHAYEEGNLGWEPAMESEVAAKAVHARLWPVETAEGDRKLRRSYHEIIEAALPQAPETVVDLGCSVGLSTFALQESFPEAAITGVDLSPYFLAIAQYRGNQYQENQNRGHQNPDPQNPDPQGNASQGSIIWKHAAAEATGLPSASYDLVSTSLMFHELPRSAARQVLTEARRLLKPGGYFTFMDMNPASPIYAAMPAYVLTLLKSTEPYLDDYFSFDLLQAFEESGFERPSLASNTSRHRTLIAKAIG